MFSELKNKEVINIRDCKSLGRVTDLEFDECSGCICKIMISECGSIFTLFKTADNVTIPFKDIKQIGPDIILVDINC